MAKILGILQSEYEGHPFYQVCLDNTDFVSKNSKAVAGVFAKTYTLKAKALDIVMKQNNLKTANELIGKNAVDLIYNDKKQIVYLNLK